MNFPALSSFHLFSQLPPELRLRIWTFATPSSRIIELTWTSSTRSLTSKTPNPSILRACHESREHILPLYKSLTFENSPQNILVDFSKDTMFFGPGCKHLVPSGRSSPWVKQNQKVVRDINTSSLLSQNLMLVAFDCEFLLGLEESEREKSLEGMLDALIIVGHVVVVKTVDGDEMGNEGELQPVLSDWRMDGCLRRLEAYRESRKERAKLVLSKAVYKTVVK
ncbi:hypothetical protein VTL71DRAFT_8571 [Oculimacula yallundae]|uniref:2EXR domain-containing protein n=1 Tax=Oculimacula yallundae TaxID=86028 RepID=A0ABR4CYZ6_9HELO